MTKEVACGRFKGGGGLDFVTHDGILPLYCFLFVCSAGVKKNARKPGAKIRQLPPEKVTERTGVCVH